MDNMQTPPPADLNKLKHILGNAKSIIKKDSVPNNSRGVEQNKYSQERSGYDDNIQYLSEEEMLKSQHSSNMVMGDSTRRPGPISEASIKNSKMPDEIKKMMLENPIAQPTMDYGFNLDGLTDLIEPKPNLQTQPQPSRMNEGSVIKNPNDTFTVSETALRGIIKDVLVEYLANDFSKKLTEATIKKTINTLIKEGKVKTKPKQ